LHKELEELKKVVKKMLEKVRKNALRHAMLLKGLARLHLKEKRARAEEGNAVAAFRVVSKKLKLVKADLKRTKAKRTQYLKNVHKKMQVLGTTHRVIASLRQKIKLLKRSKQETYEGLRRKETNGKQKEKKLRKLRSMVAALVVSEHRFKVDAHSLTAKVEHLKRQVMKFKKAERGLMSFAKTEKRAAKRAGIKAEKLKRETNLLRRLRAKEVVEMHQVRLKEVTDVKLATQARTRAEEETKKLQNSRRALRKISRDIKRVREIVDEERRGEKVAMRVDKRKQVQEEHEKKVVAVLERNMAMLKKMNLHTSEKLHRARQSETKLMKEFKLLHARDVNERVRRKKALEKLMLLLGQERARYRRELAKATAMTVSVEIVARKATHLTNAIVLLHSKIQRLKTEKKIALLHLLAEQQEGAKLAKKMQLLKVVGELKLNKERSNLVKAVAMLKHEKTIDAAKLRAEKQREVDIRRHAMRVARDAAHNIRMTTILSKDLRVHDKKHRRALSRLKKLRSSDRKLKRQLLTERRREAAESLRIKKVLQERSEALKVTTKTVENLKKILDKIHKKLKMRSRMLRQILTKEHEKKKVLMTLKRAKEIILKTTHLTATEKRLHRQLEIFKRETMVLTSRLTEEKMRLSDEKRRLKRERENERAVRRRTLVILKRQQKQRKIFLHTRRQLVEKLKEQKDKEDVEQRRLGREESSLVVAIGTRSHLREKVQGLTSHYLGLLGTAKKEKKRLEAEVKRLSDEKKRGKKEMAILTRALRKEGQKLKHLLLMKRNEKLQLQTSREVLHQDTLTQKGIKGREREVSRKERQAEGRAYAERLEMAATKIAMAKLVRKIRRLQQKERDELVHLKSGKSEVARKERELKEMTARDMARVKSGQNSL